MNHAQFAVVERHHGNRPGDESFLLARWVGKQETPAKSKEQLTMTTGMTNLTVGINMHQVVIHLLSNVSDWDCTQKAVSEKSKGFIPTHWALKKKLTYLHVQ